MSLIEDIDLESADEVCRVLEAGAAANESARCRRGSIDYIEAPGRLIATGDLHDNPLHLMRVLEAAGMREPGRTPAAHLTLHEIIHSDRLINGMDFSYRALVRVAAVKGAFAEHLHTLLANHELAQMTGAGIVKAGVRVVEAFDAALDHAFGDDAERVRTAVRLFIRSMPLALRCHTRRGDILCAHSLPGPALMGRFDPDILSRELRDEDYEPRTGSAYMMVWGRGYDAGQLEDLVERWGVRMFILGHEHTESGFEFVPPNTLVLNTDHERGVFLPIDLDDPPRPSEAAWSVMPLRGT